MHPKRRLHRFYSQVSLFAMLTSSLPIPAMASGSSPADPIFSDTSGPQTPPQPPVRPAGLGTGDDLPARPPRRQPAEPAANANTSVNALCDPDSEAGGGQGGRILNWPPRTDSEYPHVVEAYFKERKENILDNLSKLHMHYSNPSDATKPDLRESMKARKSFFDLSFGTNSAVIVICEAKREMTKYMEAYTQALSKRTATEGVTACEGADREMVDAYTKAKAAYTHLSGIIEKRQKGHTVSNHHIEGLEPAFFKYRRVNRVVNQQNSTKIKADNADAMKMIDAEFKMLWGTKSGHQSDNDPNVDPNGHYSNFLLQVRQEKKVTDEKAKWFEDNKAKFEEMKARCGSVVPATDIAGRPPGGRETPPRRDAPPAEEPPEREPPAREPPARVAPPPAEEPPAREPPSRFTPPEDTGGSRPPPKKDGSGMSGFLKDNWMWLAGGAAVVGGVVVYKNYKDGKEREKSQDAALNYLKSPIKSTPYNPDRGPSGGSDSVDTAPPGSKLIILQAIGNVAQGATMPRIEVQVTDAGGVPVKVNGLAIEVGCYTPQPCSLTGGKNVTTIDGKVAFDSLKFNQAHTGVKLQFHAAGVATVTTPSTFDVTPTNVRRDETRNDVVY